jgi:uncharacterized membrane protein HdeD (DUF308 family)
MATAVADLQEEPVAPPRWLLITSGILWLLVSLVLLSLDATSAATLGYMIGFVVLLAGANEFVFMFMAEGWKWVHGILGVLFILGGFAALLEPFQTFGILALFIGWFLLIKGFMDIAMAVGLRHQLPLWGLSLTSGILEVLLGFWALGYPGRSAWLLLVWTGFGAMFRGIANLVAAFSHGGS